jgi:hypothetical protein
VRKTPTTESKTDPFHCEKRLSPVEIEFCCNYIKLKLYSMGKNRRELSIISLSSKFPGQSLSSRLC